MRPALVLLRREFLLAARVGGGALTGLVFFLCLVATVPFAIGPDLRLLARIGPALLWIGALLAVLLALDRLFQADEEDGSLDLLATGVLPLPAVVALKCFAHWLATVLPLALCAPLLGIMLGMSPPALGRTALTLLVGTPALTALGAVGAALTVSLRRGGLLLAVLVLPLAVPVLIFGVAAAGAEDAAAATGALAVLAGLSLGALALAPFAAAGALRALRD